MDLYKQALHEEADSALRRVACHGLILANASDVERVARALWTEGYQPTLREMPPGGIRDACYLLDCLSRSNVYTGPQRTRLQEKLVYLKTILPPPMPFGNNLQDSLAASWGATADYLRFKQVLFPLQTAILRRNPLSPYAKSIAFGKRVPRGAFATLQNRLQHLPVLRAALQAIMGGSLTEKRRDGALYHDLAGRK